ncbi:MAG: class II glutamine amidotransferase [Euryarchaeota archaeon]|nr:class II glutamine amidotransferase [Euryarchaeota archaeon]
MATRPAGAGDADEVLAAFRRQARFGATGTQELRAHADGWGIAAGRAGRPQLVGRSVADAFDDPRYDEAVRVANTVPRGALLLAHLRNASVGGKRPENTHPFVADGWAFAHNGTIHGSERIAAGDEPHEGDTDSERFFRRFLHEWKRTREPEAALRATVDLVDARCTYTSITCLFTDGRTLYGYRRLGSDPGECGTKECQRDHYQLGVGRRGASVVVAQEPTHLGLDGWETVPDGFLLEWREGGKPTTRGLAPGVAAR